MLNLGLKSFKKYNKWKLGQFWGLLGTAFAPKNENMFFCIPENLKTHKIVDRHLEN